TPDRRTTRTRTSSSESAGRAYDSTADTSQAANRVNGPLTPRGPAEVPDEMEARLVVLGPDHPHAAGTEVTPARSMVETILSERASGPRAYRNTLVFMAPDKARLEELREAARSYLAWKSI